MQEKKHSAVESTVLGQTITYPKSYSPEILVAIPRKWNREIYDIQDSALPFVGIDAWHAYELSFLTTKGLPVNGLMKFIFPADSSSIVESKSLKLYLNSFNMSRFGATKSEGIKEVSQVIKDDLSKLLHCNVQVHLFEHLPENEKLFPNFELLDTLPSLDHLIFDQFNESPDLLVEDSSIDTVSRIQWTSEMLRSNCKVTNQPDWGTLFIDMKGVNVPTKESLLQYVVSMRNENHFHEEICEMIFKRLHDRFNPEELMVACVYTRRGGIDICPVRYTSGFEVPNSFSEVDQLFTKCLRQ